MSTSHGVSTLILYTHRDGAFHQHWTVMVSFTSIGPVLTANFTLKNLIW